MQIRTMLLLTKKTSYLFLLLIVLFSPACSGDMIEKAMQSAEDPRIPEINVKQGSTNIASSGGSYSLGSVKVNSQSASITFTIENNGTADLILNGSPAVVISGTNAELFTIASQPTVSIIGAGRNATFNMIFTPVTLGEKSATLTIDSNDPDESTYAFTVSGTTFPAPDFSARLRKGIGYLSVVFKDKSEGEITDWEWDFDNDGIIDSTFQNPDYKYNTSGTYSVRLKVTGPDGSDEKIISRYIEIIDPIYNSIAPYFVSPSQIQTAKINADSFIDIIGVSNNSSSGIEDLSWWQNVSGDGLSWSKQIIATGLSNYNYMQSSKVGFIDSDSSIDILTGSGSYLIFWGNNGNGTFTEHPITSSFSYLYSVDIADMDGDGIIDVIGAAYDTDSAKISWWRNDGTLPDDGTSWVETEIYDTIDDNIKPNDIYCADLNGGGIDVIAAHWVADEIVWWENPVDFGVEKNIIESGFDSAQSVHAADLDKDGDLDILGSASGTANEIAWWENDGNGIFGTKLIIDDEFYGANCVYAEDMDGDGDLDILGTASGLDQIAWWENDGNEVISWIKHTVDDSFNDALSVCTADINNDGNMDVIGAARDNGNGKIAWWRIKKEWFENNIDSNFSGESVTAFDMNNDSDKEIVCAVKNVTVEPDIILWKKDNSGNYTDYSIDVAFNDAICANTGDVNQDGYSDLLGISESGEIAWWENNTDNTFGLKQTICTDYLGAIDVFSLDIDGDGDNDILSASKDASNNLVWWENNGNNEFVNGDIESPLGCKHIIDASFVSPTGFEIKDINKDGRVDIIGSAYNSNTSADLILWLNQGGGSFNRSNIDSSFNQALTICTSDINNDEEIDIISTSFSSSQVAYYLNDGNENFAKHIITSSFQKPVAVYVTDVNGDGNNDVLGIRGSTDYINCWENDSTLPDDGTSWEEHKIEGFSVGTQSKPHSIFIADIDADDDMDILGVPKADNKISWWENNIINYGQ